jgi:hypothetical protein
MYRHTYSPAPLFITIILSVAYGLTLAPGLSWANGGADGGDLITAAALDGVPHPTGYPLYLLIAGFFQKIPLGNLAYRTNLMSAVCSVMAALLVYLIARKLFQGTAHGEVSACVVSLVFGLSPMVWSQAVITEVYALQSLLTISILYQAFLPLTGKGVNLGRGLLLGVALGNHITSLFLAPLLFWEGNTFRPYPLRRLTVCALGLCVGLLLYLILPWRAAHSPVVNWHNPTSLESFFQLISGHIYQGYLSFNFAGERLRGWIGLLLEQFSLAGVAIGVFGLLDDKQDIKRSFIFVWIFIVYGVFALVYSSYDSYIYLIPTALVFSFWIGKGVQLLLQAATLRWIKSGALFYILLGFVLAFYGISGVKSADASKDQRAENFGAEVLSVAPDNGILFARGDEAIFALWYFHFALHKRPDLVVIASDLLTFDWYRQNLRNTYPSLRLPEPSTYPSDVLAANPLQPICYVEWNDYTKMTCEPDRGK